MKAKTNTILIVVAILSYWLGLCNASAFYDPGTQRWLNRDPLGEFGFEFLRLVGDSERIVYAEESEGASLFAFVGNDGINYFDDYGNGKRPARNRDRKGHGPGGDDLGRSPGGNKHGNANRYGGREKPNFTRAPGKGTGRGSGRGFARCEVLGAIWSAMEQINDDLPYEDVAHQGPDGPECPSRAQIKKQHCFLFWCYDECWPPMT